MLGHHQAIRKRRESIPGCIFPQIIGKTKSGNQYKRCPDDIVPFLNRVRNKQFFKNSLNLGIHRNIQNTIPYRTGLGNFVGEEPDLILGTVIPEPSIIGMQICTICNKRDRLGLALRMAGPALLNPPLLTVTRRGKYMIVLKKLAV